MAGKGKKDRRVPFPKSFRETLALHVSNAHKNKQILFTFLKSQGVDDALIQPYSGHETRVSLEIYSKLSLSQAQEIYEEKIKHFPV